MASCVAGPRLRVVRDRGTDASELLTSRSARIFGAGVGLWGKVRQSTTGDGPATVVPADARTALAVTALLTAGGAVRANIAQAKALYT